MHHHPQKSHKEDYFPKKNPECPRSLIKFRHGLGDAVQLTTVLQHLKHYHPDWDVDVAALIGKHSAFHGLCRKVFVLDREELPGPSTESWI